MQSYIIMYVLLCSLHSICRFLFNYSIKVIVVLTTFSIISIPYLLNSVLQPYFMPIYSIILLYLFICNMSHVLEINYLILFYLILYVHPTTSCMMHIQTLYITQIEVFTIVKKHSRQLYWQSDKTEQFICPHLINYNDI